MNRKVKSAAAAALGALATVPFSFDLPLAAPLVPLALAALLALAADERPRRAAGLGWLFGFGFFGAGVYWVYISTHIYGGAPAWLGALMGLSLFSYLAVYPAVVLGLSLRWDWLRDPRGWIGFPALWMLAELVRGWFYSGFPWLSLGYASLDTPLARLAPMVGVTGISGVIALAGLALFRLARTGERTHAAGVLLGLVALGLFAPAAERWTEAHGAPLSVAIVQGNVAQDDKWKPAMQLPILERYRDMTHAAEGVDLIVWPEVALTQSYDQLREPFLAPLGARLAGMGTALFTGIVIEAPEQHGVYNSLIALGASQGRYDKHHLVPFGEYFPIPDFLRPLMIVLGTPYSDFLFGALQQPPIAVKDASAGVSICFEDAFGNEIRRVAENADFLVNVTNDAWFGRSPAARQHLAIARMRALETGRMTVRAANTGISAIIAPDGGLLARSGHFTTEILRAAVQPRTGLTPYVRWGDEPLWWGSALALAAAVLLGRRRIRAAASAAP
jgi:apolipoprotein N-acyltransferase